MSNTGAKMVILTLDLIHACKTERGGFTAATVRALGLPWKEMTHGWPRRLVGRPITAEAYQGALAGRYKAKGRRRDNPGQLEADLPTDQGTPVPGGW